MGPCPTPLFLVLSSCLILRPSSLVVAATTATARISEPLVFGGNISEEFMRLGLAVSASQLRLKRSFVGQIRPQFVDLRDDLTAAISEEVSSARVDILSSLTILQNAFTKQETVLSSLQDQLAPRTGQLSEEFGPSPTGTSALNDCPDGWIRDNRNCFFKSQAHLTWHEAQGACTELDPSAKLASLHVDTVDTIYRFIGTSPVWIGLHRVMGSARWSWADGSPVDYTNWRSGEPNNVDNREDCVDIFAVAGLWNDRNCSTKITYICHLHLS